MGLWWVAGSGGFAEGPANGHKASISGFDSGKAIKFIHVLRPSVRALRKASRPGHPALFLDKIEKLMDHRFLLYEHVVVLQQPLGLRDAIAGKEGIIVGMSDLAANDEFYGVHFSELGETFVIHAAAIVSTGYVGSRAEVRSNKMGNSLPN